MSYSDCFIIKHQYLFMLCAGTPGKHIVAAGVASATEKDEVISQKYYQWVCFVLALQAAAFYIPRHLWKTWEAGRLKMLVGDLGENSCKNNKFHIIYIL